MAPIADWLSTAIRARHVVQMIENNFGCTTLSNVEYVPTQTWGPPVLIPKFKLPGHCTLKKEKCQVIYLPI
jgi:hypothetical protein